MNTANRTKLISLLFAAVLAACSSEVIVYQYQYDSTLDEVFVKQGIEFSQYSGVIIDQISSGTRINTNPLLKTFKR